MKYIHIALACSLLVPGFSRAQSGTGTQAPPASQSQTAAQPPSKEGPGEDNKGQADKSSSSKDRLFFALPNFLTVENAANVPPLTAGGKFKLIGRSAFDPVQFAWYGALSGISQAENSEPGYGQGAQGYGKRYGAYFADGTIENFMVGAVLPSILRTDPRFYQSGKGGSFHRTGYALSRAFITRKDSGNSEFNYPEIFGSALASAISTYSYHPKRTFRGFDAQNNPLYWPSDRTLKNTASVWGTQVGYDTLTFVIKEFWPDIRRKIQKQPK